jgi:uncharacterized protein (TIGR02466 family)
MKSNLIDIFSIPLYQAKLTIDNDKLLQYCYSVEEKDPGRNISNQGGYQSNDLPEDDELDELFEQITKHSHNLCNQMQISPVYMWGSWINTNRKSSSNWPHTHNTAIISGVYYVKVPENSGDIEFQSPTENLMHPFQERINSNKYNSDRWLMPSIESVLYLFPAWLSHGVKPNFTDEDRVSIAFNMIH